MRSSGAGGCSSLAGSAAGVSALLRPQASFHCRCGRFAGTSFASGRRRFRFRRFPLRPASCSPWRSSNRAKAEPARSKLAPNASPAPATTQAIAPAELRAMADRPALPHLCVETIARSTTPILSAAILNSAANAFKIFATGATSFSPVTTAVWPVSLSPTSGSPESAIARFKKAVFDHVHFRSRRRETIPQFAELIRPSSAGNRSRARTANLSVSPKDRKRCWLFRVSYYQS